MLTLLDPKANSLLLSHSGFIARGFPALVAGVAARSSMLAFQNECMNWKARELFLLITVAHVGPALGGRTLLSGFLD